MYIYIFLDLPTTCCFDTNKAAPSTLVFLAKRAQTGNVVTISMCVCPKILTLRLLMSYIYIYGAPILDVSRIYIYIYIYMTLVA